MKRIFILTLLIAVYVSSFGQYVAIPDGRYMRLRIDSSLRIPVFGAISVLANMKYPSVDTGGLAYVKEDSSIYRYTGSQWLVVAGNGSGYVTTSRNIATSAPLFGGGSLATDRTIGINQAKADGSTRGAAAFAENDFNDLQGVISLDYTNILKANEDQDGLMTATSYRLLVDKVDKARRVNTTSPLIGGGDLSVDRTLSIQDAVANGVTKGAATFATADFDGNAGLISIDYVNGQTATEAHNGFLKASDFTLFSSKLSGTTNTYTPTITNVTNVTSSAPTLCNYMRVGNMVIVYGRVDLNITSAEAVFIGISLPIASAFVAETDLHGTSSSDLNNISAGAVYADATNDRAQLTAVSSSTGSHTVYFSFMYTVL
jgi:hypothetical protein